MIVNTLLEEVQYKVQKTRFGTWKSFGYTNGASYHEFTSNATIMGMPLFHYTYGINPQTGTRKWAKGFIAVGRFAYGVIAIGHVAAGVVAVGQLAIGFVLSVGQGCVALLAIGQIAIGILFGLGQFATGYIAIGQFAVGTYVLGQAGFGKFVWSMKTKSPEAVEFFKSFLPINI